MTNKLPCAVVRDLLPSYLEGLTEPETAALVQEHLHACPACNARYQALSGEETPPAASEAKQVDYLKQVRRKGRRRVLLGIAAACLVVLLLVGCGLFSIGLPVRPEHLFYDMVYETQLSEDGKALGIQMHTTSSALALAHETVRTQDGTASVTVRQVLVSPLHTSGTVTVWVPLQEVDSVQLLGQTVWEQDLEITQWVAALHQTRTPYVGSMSNVAKVAGLLPLPPVGYTNELLTGAAPYGWVLHFTEPLTADQQAQVRQALPLALALVDNLDEIYWTWPGMTDAQRAEACVTTAGCTAQLPALVDNWNQAHTPQLTALPTWKAYGESACTLQQLWNLLGL